jgi:hypothetical protein
MMSNVREDLKFAVENIDHVLGSGYAKAHPELIAAFIHADGLAQAGYAIRNSIDNLAENIRTDHPLMGETFVEITQALGWIASAISENVEVKERPKMNGEKEQHKS